MNTCTRTASAHRIARTILALVCVALGGLPIQPAAADPLPPPERALVYVSEPEDITRIEALGLPVYARLEGRDGPYLLVGANPRTATGAPSDAATGIAPDATSGDLGRLAAAGLTGRILDPDMTGATYYLVYPAPGRPTPPWERYGQLLLDDGQAVLLRAAPSDAERLAAAGAEIALVTLAPKPLQPMAAASFPPVTAADPLVRSMTDQVSQTKLAQYVRELSGETAVIIGGAPYTIITRNTDSGTPIQKATQYVGEHLGGLGLTVESHQWHATRPPNVIGQITGKTTPAQIFLVGAHLDDMPSGASAPGADDNASGSAAVLVAADILSQYQWGCTLRFALWTGEEQGLLGSAAYAQRSHTQLPPENIAGVLNLDMIAWNTPGSARDIDLHAKSTLPATVELANQFSSVVTAYNLNLVPQVVTAGIGASDHASFWNWEYAAILAIEDYLQPSGDFNPRYHKADGPGVEGDRLQYLDMGYFTDLVKASVGDFVHMSDCLLTGALDGGVTASHDDSVIASASITMTDTHDLTYTAGTDATGHYGRTLPAATYTMTASAYGYLSATVTGVPLPTAGVTQNFVLQAAPPVAPQVSISVNDTAQLTWTHVAPNMTYTVHREAEPYFTPALDNQKENLGLPFADTIIYDDPDDLTGLGNQFYAVVGKNATGAGAPPDRVAIFNFDLQPGG
jgi:hypothetical protein